MGQYLGTPVTEKETVHGSHPRLHYGISAQQGWRKAMVSLPVDEWRARGSICSEGLVAASQAGLAALWNRKTLT